MDIKISTTPGQGATSGQGLPPNQGQSGPNQRPGQQGQPQNRLPLTRTALPPEKQPSFFKQNKLAFWIILASIAVLAGGLYLLLRKPSASSIQPKVTVAIDAPQQLASGSEVIYKITVSNQDNATIKNVALDLIYPQGFTYEDSSPKPTKLNGTEFALPPIDPSVRTTIQIKGTLQGNASETKTISTVMHFVYSNLNSDFVQQAQAQTQIKPADVAVQFDGPANADSSQDVAYTLSYSNYTDKQIKGFAIQFAPPKDFHLTSAEPKATRTNIWYIGVLNPNQSGQIILRGNFNAAHTGDQETFSASAVGSWDSASPYALSSGQLIVTISPQPMSADMSLQTQTDNGAVAPGAQLIYQVAYKNNGSTVATGVQVQATLAGAGAFDLTSVRADKAVISGNTITWDGSQVPNLAALSPGDGGTLTFTVNVKDPATRSNIKNISLLAQSSIKSNESKQPYVGAAVNLKVKTTAVLSDSLTYVGGAEPPSVGATTTYQVNLALINSTNDITGGILTFNLPNTSNFDIRTVNPDQAANVTYDPSTKKLTWNVGTVPAHAGEFVPAKKLQFNFSIKPGVTDRQTQMILVNNIRFNGTDDFTSLPISISLNDITTQQDPSASGGVQ